MASETMVRTTGRPGGSGARATAAIRRVAGGVTLLGLTVALSGCLMVGRSARRAEAPAIRLAGATVLIMEPEVRLWTLNVMGNVLQPQAEWTAAGREHVRVALGDELRARGAGWVPYAAPDDPVRRRAHDQLGKLHRVVSRLARRQLAGELRLPTKRDGLDWTLGDEAGSLREEYQADYALFVAFEDSYQEAGAIGTALVAIISLGTLWPPPGEQAGAASLVDLRTGDLVWIRTIAGKGGGDLRRLAPARKVVGTLLKDLPR